MVGTSPAITAALNMCRAHGGRLTMLPSMLLWLSPRKVQARNLSHSLAAG